MRIHNHAYYNLGHEVPIACAVGHKNPSRDRSRREKRYVEMARPPQAKNFSPTPTTMGYRESFCKASTVCIALMLCVQMVGSLHIIAEISL
jgi:hypothetical protein